MPDKDILKLIVEGGLGVAMFFVWLITNKNLKSQTSEAINTAKEAVTCANKTSQEAFDKHTDLSKELIQLLKDEQEYKTTLTGILDRISIKLETPAQCPILLTGKKFTFEVKE